MPNVAPTDKTIRMYHLTDFFTSDEIEKHGFFPNTYLRKAFTLQCEERIMRKDRGPLNLLTVDFTYNDEACEYYTNIVAFSQNRQAKTHDACYEYAIMNDPDGEPWAALVYNPSSLSLVNVEKYQPRLKHGIKNHVKYL